VQKNEHTGRYVVFNNESIDLHQLQCYGSKDQQLVYQAVVQHFAEEHSGSNCHRAQPKFV